MRCGHPLHAKLESAQATHLIQRCYPLLLHRKNRVGAHAELQITQAGHVAGDDGPAVTPLIEAVRVDGGKTHFDLQPAEVEAGDGGQLARNDGAGEADKGAELVDVKGVGGVEHARGFGVHLPAGFQQCHVGRRYRAQEWMKRNPNGRTTVSNWIRGPGESTSSVGDAAWDLNEMDDGASEDIAIDFQPKFQRQARK